jgi:hypothetical protein
MTNMTMDRVGAPPDLWLLYLGYVVFILNRLAHVTLNGQTPTYILDMETTLISGLCCCSVLSMQFKSKSCCFVEIKENVDDALAFLVLTDDTN